MNKRLIILLAAAALAAILFTPFYMPGNTGNANVSDANASTKGNLSDYYPEHPTLADCEKTSKRDFCIGDVAEISNNVDICQQINDPDIRNFCIARISIDKNLCNQLLDEGLRGACLESIELKTT